MMRSSSKILAVAAALSMAAASCGSGDGEPAAEESPGTAEAQETSAAGDGDAGENAEAPDTLTVGALYGMTGAFASYGEQHANGSQLAIDQINDAGGAGGVTIELEIENHEADGAKGVQALNKLATVTEVPWVFTSFTNIVSATAPVGTEHEIVMMNGGATAPTLAGLSPYLFHNVPLESLHTRNVATYAYEELGLRTLAILYTNDALGTANRDEMQEVWTDLGGEVVATESGDTDTSDFRGQLTQLRNADPDAVYMTLGGQQLPTVLNQKTELGLDAQFIGTSFSTIPEVLDAAGGASEGLIFSTQQWDPNNPEGELASQFVEDYEERYGELPLGNAAAYYVGGRVLGDVVTYLVDEGRELTGPEMRAALIEIPEFETIFGPLSFSEDGTSEMPLTLMTVEDNQFVPLDE